MYIIYIITYIYYIIIKYLSQVYQGYVDDPSNTDNAWYETTALNYHDSDGSSFANFPLDTVTEH